MDEEYWFFLFVSVVHFGITFIHLLSNWMIALFGNGCDLFLVSVEKCSFLYDDSYTNYYKKIQMLCQIRNCIVIFSRTVISGMIEVVQNILG